MYKEKIKIMTSKDYAKHYLSELKQALKYNDEYAIDSCAQYILEVGDPATVIEMQNLLNQYDNGVNYEDV